MSRPMKIFCREHTDMNLATHGNAVVLAVANPRDESQQWLRDYSASGRVTDNEGQRAFALVNKASGQAMVNKNIPRPGDGLVPVQLDPYSGDLRVEVSMLWTEGTDDLGDGFHEVRVLTDISKSLNALFGGPVIGIYPSEGIPGPNAAWKFTPV